MNFLNLFYRFRKLIVTFVLIIGFFSYYNMFLIDNTLENLRFSLEQTAIAYDVGDTNGLDIVITQVTAKEISPKTMNAFDIGNLEFAKSIVQQGKNFNQLDYLKLALISVIKEKEKNRGFLLTLLDRLNRPVRKGMIYLAYLPRYLLRPRLASAQTAGETAEISFLDKIRSVEKEENLENAILKYNALMTEYAGTDKAPLLKLRIGYVYHRLGKYDEAIKLYKDVLKIDTGKEARIARILLDSLKTRNELLDEANLLIIRASEIPEKEVEAKQNIFYQLGLVYTKLFNLEEARKFFRRAIDVSPSSELAVKSQFNMAWMLKQENRFRESHEEFSKIVKEKPESVLVLESRNQITDVLHSEGKFEEAAELEERMAEEYKDDKDMASLLLFQAGATYMYDLNDTKKAKEIFAKLTAMYPDSIYSKFLAPEKSAIGMFLTYVVPRATNVAAWRAGGLYALSGLSGELAKGSATFEEAGLNVAVNDWIADEFPDTLGDIYFDIRGMEIELKKNNILISGNVTFGKWMVRGEGELHFELTKTGGARAVITKVFLNKIPIPPLLINNGIAKLTFLINKYFPLVLTKISMEEGTLYVEGYGSKRMLERIQNSLKNRLAGDTKVEDLEGPEASNTYNLFKERFPASDFSPSPKYGTEELFLDFMTRMNLYAGFKLLETVKDSKLDYQRSIRTLGRLMLVESRFRVNYTQNHVNTNIARFISNEFPWVLNNSFLFDIIGLRLHFKDGGEIDFQTHLGLGYSKTFPMEPERVYVTGTMRLEIDRNSKLPKIVFTKANLNNIPYPVEKLNLVTLNTFNLLKDARMPLKIEEINVYEGGISLKGRSPRDYTERIFSDPYLFVIFHVRDADMGMAGVGRLRTPLSVEYEQYRGTTEGETF